MIVYARNIGEDKTSAENAILKAHGMLTGKCVTIERNSGKKPAVRYNGEKKGNVSISHTDDLLLIAFSDSEVGIDAERADRQVSPAICKDIAEWTKYEAYGKYLGCGISKKFLSMSLPGELVFGFDIDGYVVSIASEDKKVDIIKLTS